MTSLGKLMRDARYGVPQPPQEEPAATGEHVDADAGAQSARRLEVPSERPLRLLFDLARAGRDIDRKYGRDA